MKKFSLASVILSVAVSALAQTTVTTTPSGYVNLTAAAGTGTTSTLSVLSFPLLSPASITGQSTGLITAVSAGALTNSAAGWAAGTLSVPATPYVLLITSGTAKGRTFLLSTTTANTATTVTVDSQEASQIDLTTLGIVAGTDTYSLYPCDTLLGAFGAGSATVSTSTALGSTAAAGADVLQLNVSGAWRQYFFNTTTGHWARVGPNTNSDNVPIRPDTGVIYSRLAASALNITVTGNVPSVDRKAIVTNSGITFLSSSWPVDLTLATAGISSIPGWVASTSASGADIVQVSVSGAWRQYYYNSVTGHWYRVGPNTQSDAVSIPVGSAVILTKNGVTAGVTTLAQTLPYTP